MSGLGELLLGKSNDTGPNRDSINDDDGSSTTNKNGNDGEKLNCYNRQEKTTPDPNRDGSRDDQPYSHVDKTFPHRVEKDNQDNQSNASSTDDYVRELLDPNDRPRNVWHVVEGPKKEPDEDRASERIPKRDNRNDDASNRSRPSETQPEANTDISPGHQNMDQNRSHEKDSRNSQSGRISGKESEYARHSASRERSPSRHHSYRHDRSRRRSSKEDRSHRDVDQSGHRSSKHRSSSKRAHSDHEDDKDSNYGRRHRKSSRYSKRRSPDSRSRSRSLSRSPVSSSSRRRERSRSGSPQRNSRTIIVMQLSQRVVSRDIEDYFTDNVGSVREVKLIMDSRTRRHKGVAYVEFHDSSSSIKALDFNGRKLHGVPMTIQPVNSSKSSNDYHSNSSQRHHYHHHSSSSSRSNHHHTTTTYQSSRSLPPNAYRVYIGALHTGLTEEMLKTIVEPFGPVLRVEIIKDRTTGLSRGYAFVTYANIEDGQEAVKSLDGFELAGKIMRVSKSTEKSNSEH